MKIAKKRGPGRPAMAEDMQTKPVYFYARQVEDLEKICEERGLKFSALVRELVQKFLEKRTAK